MDAQTQQVLADFSQEIRRLRGQVDSLQRAARTPQLAHSSLEEGQAIETRSEDGTTRQLIGWLPDGTVGMITEGGNPVSAPTAPTVTPSLGGLRVTWDGALSGELALPGDFDHMAVHVSTASGFVPSAATYVGSIRRAGEGGMLPVVPLPYVEHYVRLVPVTTGGVQGVPSAEVAATPLQVDGADLTAGSVTAPIIAGGAVTADKLEAILVLASTIVAGIPGAARVELDQDGLRGYDSENTLVFAVDATGNAVFSGDITASEITGSRFLMGQGDATGAIEEVSNGVHARVRSGTMQASLGAINNVDNNAQANFVAVSDQGNPSTPMASFGAFPGSVLFGLDSSSTSADGLPAVRGVAVPTSAQLTLWSQLNNTDHPYQVLYAAPGQSGGQWTAATGSQIHIRALPDHASIVLSAPQATDPDDAQSPGYIFTQRYDDDIAAASMQGPVWEEGSGPERGLRAMLHLEGARPDRTYTGASYSAARHTFQQQYNMNTDSRDTGDGVVDVRDTHSILAPRHEPIRSDMVANPSFGTTGGFVDFTSGQFPPIPFKTGWSGKVRVTITAAGWNSNTTGSQIDLGFSLSGASSVPAARTRSWVATAATMQHSSRVLHLNLVGNADYTLTPAWRITSGSAATAQYSLSFENSIVVEPLM